MNNIEKLLAELCPNGVEFKTLYELGSFYGGLIGKSKDDFSNGNAKFITYMNVFSNIKVNTNITDFVKVGENENQNKVELGDVLFTGSSETSEECGMSSVLTEQIDDPLYLNSFCFGLRLNDKTMFSIDFLKFLFRGDNLRKQIVQTASGVTRFNVSKKRMEKVLIPVPHIEIQKQISSILNKFTDLEADLEAELEARRKQYEYYRNHLMLNDKWLLKELGDVGVFIRGNGLQKKDFTENGVGCIHYGQIYTYYGAFTDKTISFVSEELAKKLKKVSKDDLIITNTSENVEDVCKTVAWLGNYDIVTGGHATIFKHNQNPKYLSYYTQTPMFMAEKKKYATGTKVIDVSATNMGKIKIPLPPIDEQARIVAILDKFDALVNDISIGLPAEIKMRRQQYEYYRNKLLNFKPINN